MTTEFKSHAPDIKPHIIPHNTLILVGDGQKALFLRNRGSALNVDLVVEQILERDNPAMREQGTDRPGRATASLGAPRARWKKSTGITSQRSGLQTRLRKRSITMLTPIFSTGSSSSLHLRYWANFAKRFTRRSSLGPPLKFPRS